MPCPVGFERNGVITKRLKYAALVATFTLAFGAAAERMAAQSFTIAAGVSSYDLSGTGSEAVGSLRLDGPVATGLRWQAGLGLFQYEPQFGDESTLFLPEAGLEWHPPLGRVPLYIGAGVGANLETGPGENEPTLYGAIGLDLGAGASATLRPELRVRAVDPWVGTMADVTLGLRFRD